MKKITLFIFMLILSFGLIAGENDNDRGNVPFIWGTYSEGEKVNIDFDYNRPVEYIEFSWLDESENRDSRVELWVDHFYYGSKNVWFSWDKFYINDTPGFRMELRVTSGKVRIRRAYISYKQDDFRGDNEITQYLNLAKNNEIEHHKALSKLNSMSADEQSIVLPAVLAINNQADEVDVLKDKYNEFVAENENAVDVRALLFEDFEDRSYVIGAAGNYWDGSRVRLNLEKGREIRSISVSWSTEEDFVRGELYIDGMYQGSKTIRSFSYDTFYVWDKEMDWDAHLKIRGGDVRVRSVRVNYK
ncbi:MAG: hypothetical protein ACQESP_03955 [Candidatus Muiribacteriota bacterium]